MLLKAPVHQDLELGKGAEPSMNSCHVSWDDAGLVTR